MKKHLIYFLVFSILFPLSLIADDLQYENKPIVKITIEAEDLPSGSNFQTKTVESKIKTKIGEPFSQTVFDQDLKALAKDYDKVDPKISSDGEGVNITLKVWLRPLISKIIWKGDFHFNKTKLEKELNVHAFTLFNRQNFNKGFHKLREFYMKKGYFEAQLDYEVLKDPARNEVAVEISIKEGMAGLIHKISYDGFSKEEVKDLKEKIHLKKYNPLISWYNRAGIYHKEIVDYDKMTVLQFLRNQGYANAKLEIVVKASEKKNRIDIDIRANRGEKYNFGEINFVGNNDFDNQTIAKLIEVKSGDAYSPKKVQDTVEKINAFYGKKGYIDATIAYEPHLKEIDESYSVQFKITEGTPYRVGLIKVLGNNRTQSKVILRETLLEPGTTFNTNKLEYTQKRLQNMNYYKHVNVYASPSSSTEGINAPMRDVNVEVQEISTGNMGLFAGFSTVDSVFGGIEITERNFNLAGLADVPAKGLGALRGGGEFLKIKTGLGTKLDDYSVSWTKPYFLDSNWAIGVNVNKNLSRIQSSNYTIDSLTTNVHSFYNINGYLSFNTYYRFRNLKLDVNGGSGELLYDQANNNGVVSAVGFSFLYNSKDNPYRATRGFESDFKLEYAGVGGKFNFGTFSYNNSYYIPLAKRLVSKTRADFNFILPISPTTPVGIPLGERLFLGADTTIMRGYRPFAVGPTFPNGEPAGGISSMVLSQELAFNLLPGIDVFTFFDAGSLSQGRFEINTIRTSAGAGARITALSTLPLMVGWGYAINPEFESDRQGFFISMNGSF